MLSILRKKLINVSNYILAYIYKDDLTLDIDVVEDKGGVDEGIDRIELYF